MRLIVCTIHQEQPMDMLKQSANWEVKSRSNVSVYWFLQRTINEWNKISTYYVTASSVNICLKTHTADNKLLDSQ